MNRVVFAVLCGLGFGVGTILTVLFAPIQWPTAKEKRDAMLAAFVGRFMVGLVIPLANLGVPPILNGLLISLGFSLHTAMTARRYAPILITGAIGGAVIGWIAGM